MPLFTRAALLAGVASLGLVGLASAAPQAPSAPDAPRVEKRVMIMRGGPDGPGGHGFHRRDPEKHAQHLRDILQLTPQQEPALQAFLTATKPQVRIERRGPDDAPTKPEERKPLTTPERLDLQARRMAEHQAAFEKRAAATKAFYAQLTAPQKKAFDALRPDGRGPGFRGPRIRAFGPGGPGMPPPLAFGPEDGDFLIGQIDDLDFDIEMALPPLPDMPDLPPPPAAPAKPGA